MAKNFDTVKTFRKIKDKISNEFKGRSLAEIKQYLKARSAKLQSE